MTNLSDFAKQKLHKMLIKDEGFKEFPYKDSVGKLTIGIGRNLDDRGITLGEALYLLANDIDQSIKDCRIAIKNYDSLTENRKLVLIDMVFNLGLPKFLTFKKMIRAILLGNNADVAKEMLESKWHDDVGDRAKRLAELWLGG